MIFISYSHRDNREPTEGWIGELHRFLEGRLEQLFGSSDLPVFRDVSGLRQSASTLSEEILDNIRKARFLMPVLSPSYLASEWCELERQEFLQYYGEMAKRRIFGVEKLPIMDRADFPEVLGERFVYRFFKVDPETRRSRELTANDEEFLNLVFDLAEDLTNQFREITEETESSKGTIFLAETTSDLQHQREEIRRELKMKGYKVVPSVALPFELDALRARICEHLSEATFSVHPVGRYYGIAPERSGGLSIPQIQFELAQEFAAEGKLKRLVWNPSKLEAEEDDQKTFLEYLAIDPAAQLGTDRIVGGLEHFKIILGDELNEIAVPTVVAAEETSEVSTVGILYAQADKANIKALRKAIFQAGFEVRRSAIVLEDGIPHLDNTQLLDSVEAWVIYQGEQPEDWALGVIDLLDRFPTARKAVYCAEQTDEPPMTREAAVLEFENALATTLQPFLDQLKA